MAGLSILPFWWAIRKRATRPGAPPWCAPIPNVSRVICWARSAAIAARTGVVVYLQQEGRGIGLHNKLRAYALQDTGADTIDANVRLGFPADKRDYGIGAQILADLGVRRMVLLTNNPKKLVAIQGHGLEVVDQAAIPVQASAHNIRYLTTKRDRMGHVASFTGP